MRVSRFLYAAVALAVAAVGAQVIAQQPGAGAFTAEQAQNGRDAYRQNCASCHGPTLAGGSAPELAGQAFLSTWRGKPARDLFGFIRDQMPPGGSDRLNDEGFANIVAFILQSNNVPAGAQPLRADTAAPIVPGAVTAGTAPTAAAAPAPQR